MHPLPLILMVIALAPLSRAEPAPTEAPVAATDDGATEPALEPAIVTWYQDMRLACGDKRTSLVAKHHGTQSSEPGALFGQNVWSDMARAGLVSWQAAGDPRVNDRTLARTPEPADFRPLDARSSTAAPQLYPALPAELTGRLQAIELAQAQTDTAWRAWQEKPGDEQRAALVSGLEVLQGICTRAD